MTDEVLPAGSVVINGNALYALSATVSLTLSCDDRGGSGCAWMQFSNNGSAWSTAEAYAPTKAGWDLNSIAYGGVAGDGMKTVSVRFTDAAGNTAVYSDTIMLDTTQASPPATPPAVSAASPTNNSRPSWTWTAGGGVTGTYRFQMDSESSGGWSETTATSFVPGTALTEGNHTLYVQERDQYSRWSLSGSRTVIVDLTSPDTVINSVSPASNPVNADTNTSITFLFAAPGEPGLSFECSYDAGAYVACASPMSYGTIAGAHSFSVRAVDAAGNIDPTPATYQWSALGKLVGSGYSWGQNTTGNLGNGTKDNLPHPTVGRIQGPIGFSQIAGNANVTLALRIDGTFWGWGRNANGQLGMGNSDQNMYYTLPTQINTISNVTRVAVGTYSVYALKDDGTLWSWGYDYRGSLGLGGAPSQNPSTLPQLVSLDSVMAVDSEGGHAIALKDDGTVWTWGSNEYGQLGIGSADTADHSAPVQVMQADGVTPLGSIIGVAAGSKNSFALKSDGTVWAWGAASYAGTGGAGDPTRPQQLVLSGGPTIKAIAAGYQHGLALDTNGSVWAWGDNTYGQTGSSDTINSTPTPTTVSGLSGIIAKIDAGGSNNLALSSANAAWSWGANRRGQLGAGLYDYSAHTTPQKVAYLSGVENIYVSSGTIDTTSFALKGTWVTSFLDTDAGAGRYTSLALDGNDKVHISYAGGSGGLSYMTNATGSWVNRGTIDSNIGRTGIAVDGSGNAHFSYYDQVGGDLHYALYSGGTFSQVAIDTAGDVGDYNAIAVDAGGYAHICYYDATNNRLKYATNVTGAWETTQLNSSIPGGKYCSINYNSYGTTGINIAYQGNGYLYYGSRNSSTGAWTHTRADYLTINSGVGTSITNDSSGTPHISYAVTDANGTTAQLRYISKPAHGVWMPKVVDSVETKTGLYSSIDARSSGSIYISYFDAVNMDLKVAVVDVNKGVLSLSSVDIDGYVGEYTGIALDSQGIAHVSYYSYEPSEGLKYATNAEFTGPSGDMSINNGSRFTTDTAVTLQLTCDDGMGIGCWRMQFSDDGVDWTKYQPETYSTTKAWTFPSGNGTRAIYVRFEDSANNWSTGSIGASIVLDQTKPAGSIAINDNPEPDRTSSMLVLLSLFSSDTNTVTEMSLSNDSNTWYTYPYATSFGWSLSSGVGTKTVYAKFKDAAGNWSDVVSDTTFLDNVAPVTIASPMPGGYNAGKSVNVTLTCSDQAGAGIGCSRIYYTTNGDTPSTSSAFFTGTTGTVYLSGATSPTALKFYSIDALGNQEAYQTVNYTFVPGHTKLTLDLATPTLQNNGTLEWASGKLTRDPDSVAVPNNGMDMSGLTIQLTITGPAGSYCENPASHAECTPATTTYHEFGQYKFENLGGDIFDTKGVYTISAFFSATGLHEAAQSSTESLLVGSSAGYAIIVEGKVSENEGLPSHNKTANRVYDTLKERGFEDDNIFYFNYGGSMIPGVDAVTAKIGSSITDPGIKWAITTWAKERMNGSPAPLYIIMVDHGNRDTFFIDPDTITPAELDLWLKQLELGLNAQALLEKRVVVMGACYSGSFVSALSSGPTTTNGGRIVITSATADEPSYKGPDEADGVRSGEFFLEEFFKEIKKGSSVKDSFLAATERTESYTSQGSSVSNVTNGYGDNAVQHPLLDDNGDGIGSNVLSDDGVAAAGLYMGFGNTNATLGPADIKAVTPTQALAADPNPENPIPTPVQLWAEAYSNAAVSSAWFELKSPSKDLTTGETSTATFQRTVDIPRTAMTLVGGRWQAEATFTEAGTYEIFYFTKSTNSEISEMKRSVVYKDWTGNHQPNAFDLVSPTPTDNPHTELFLSWNETTDPDDDRLTYTVQIAADDQFTTLKYQKEELGTSIYAVGAEAGLEDQTTYYWRVIAVDQYGSQLTSNQTWSFHTDNRENQTCDTSTHPAKTVTVTVTDGSTGSGTCESGTVVYQAAVVVKEGTTQIGSGTTNSSGLKSFTLCANNTFTIDITKAGYYYDSLNNAITVSTVSNLKCYQLIPIQYTLTLAKAGTGSGTVSANGAITSSKPFNTGTVVTLSATPSTGSDFTSWTGDADCSDWSVTLTASKTCTATFTLKKYTVSASVSGGNGTITPVLAFGEPREHDHLHRHAEHGISHQFGFRLQWKPKRQHLHHGGSHRGLQRDRKLHERSAHGPVPGLTRGPGRSDHPDAVAFRAFHGR